MLTRAGLVAILRGFNCNFHRSSGLRSANSWASLLFDRRVLARSEAHLMLERLWYLLLGFIRDLHNRRFLSPTFAVVSQYAAVVVFDIESRLPGIHLKSHRRDNGAYDRA